MPLVGGESFLNAQAAPPKGEKLDVPLLELDGVSKVYGAVTALQAAFRGRRERRRVAARLEEAARRREQEAADGGLCSPFVPTNDDAVDAFTRHAAPCLHRELLREFWYSTQCIY